MKKEGKNISRILHCWNYVAGEAHTGPACDNIRYYQSIGYESILAIVRGLSNFYNGPVALDVIGNGWFSLLGNEAIVPARSTTLGAVKVIPREFSLITCRAIDIPDASDIAVDALCNELAYRDKENEIAIRGHCRYIKGFENIDPDAAGKDCPFKNNGVYLITGANGGMGRVFSEYLAATFQARLILVARQDRPEGWLESLQQKGGRVFYIQADIAKDGGLEKSLHEAQSQLGAVDGVIHTAGLGDYAGLILNRKLDDDYSIFSPKIFGTEMVFSLFGDRKLDFFINCSSQSASMGPFGQVAYVAANIYQDSFAQSKNRYYPVISIQWDAMQEVGMAIRATQHLDAGEQQEALKLAITPDEAKAVILRAVQLEVAVQVVSTVDIHQAMKNYFLKFEEGLQAQMLSATLERSVFRERPDLIVGYTSPQTATQKKLTQILENFFGIEPIGIDDNFFELGGDSLKAMVMLKIVKQSFATDISVKTFFQGPCVRDLAEWIDNIPGSAVKKERKLKKII
jgi:NADP-dependent 3-hydroxy acid dehydrogenase YdfG/acyl carrier protein